MSPWVAPGALASLYPRADDHKTKPVVVVGVDQKSKKVQVQYSHSNDYVNVPFARVASTQAKDRHQLVPRSMANFQADDQPGDAIDDQFKLREVKLIPPGPAELKAGTILAIHGAKGNDLLQYANAFVRAFTAETDPYELHDFSAGGAPPDVDAYLFSHGIPDHYMCIFYRDSVGVGTGPNEDTRKRAAWISLGLQCALGDPAEREKACAWVKKSHLKGLLPLMEHVCWLLAEEESWEEEDYNDDPITKLARIEEAIEVIKTEVRGSAQGAPPRPSRRRDQDGKGAKGRRAAGEPYDTRHVGLVARVKQIHRCESVQAWNSYCAREGRKTYDPTCLPAEFLQGFLDHHRRLPSSVPSSSSTDRTPRGSGPSAPLVTEAIQIASSQLESQGGYGRVTIPQWAARFQPVLGLQREFLESLPLCFTVHSHGRRSYSVELVRR